MGEEDGVDPVGPQEVHVHTPVDQTLDGGAVPAGVDRFEVGQASITRCGLPMPRPTVSITFRSSSWGAAPERRGRP